MEDNLLTKWVEEGIEQGFLLNIAGKYKLNNSVNRTVLALSQSTLVTVKKELSISNIQPVLTVDELFLQFIKGCEIPTKTNNGRGGFYWINRFSKDAAKEFHRVVTKENVNLQVLVASTKLYYLQTKECAKTISNYIIEGIWRSGYSEMLEKVNSGTVQEYIKLETQTDVFSKDI